MYFFSNFSSMWPHILLWRMAYRENPHYFLSHEWKVVSSSPTPLVGCPPSSQILMIFLPFKERYFFACNRCLLKRWVEAHQTYITYYSTKVSHKNELTFDFIRKLNMKCCCMHMSWVWYGIELEYLQLLCYIIIDAFVSLFGMI